MEIEGFSNYFFFLFSKTNILNITFNWKRGYYYLFFFLLY